MNQLTSIKYFLIDSFIIISPLSVDYTVRAKGKFFFTFPSKAAFFSGATMLGLASRVLSAKQCLLMTVLYVAYKALQFTEISPSPGDQQLDLADFKLTEIPKHVYGRQDLGELNLSHNELSEVSFKVGDLKGLKSLNLSRNQLKAIPKEIYKLINLSKFYLGHNRFQSVSQEICKLTQLSYLSLKNNQLKELPEQVGDLRNLEHLNLSNNQLQTVPMSLARLSSKCVVDLRQNSLSQDVIQQLEGHIQREKTESKGVLGPQLLYSKESFNASAVTLGDVIKKWLEKYDKYFPNHSSFVNSSLQGEGILAPYQSLLEHNEARELQTFLEKLEPVENDEQEYDKLNVTSKVKQMLDLASTNEQFREELFTASYDASSSCGFKAIHALCNIDIQVQLRQEGITDIRRAEILIGMHRRNLLKVCVDKRLVQQKGDDPMFVYLYYDNQLKGRLNFPVLTLTEIKPSLVDWVTEEMLEQDTTLVLEQTTQLQDIVNILLAYDAWKKHVDTIKQEQIRSINETISSEINQLMSNKRLDGKKRVEKINKLNQQRQEKISNIQTRYTEEWVKVHLD